MRKCVDDASLWWCQLRWEYQGISTGVISEQNELSIEPQSLRIIEIYSTELAAAQIPRLELLPGITLPGLIGEGVFASLWDDKDDIDG